MTPSQPTPDAFSGAEGWRRVRDLIDRHPELELVRHEFDSPPDGETVAAILDAHEQSMLHLKHLLNPTCLPLEMSADGRVLTRTFEGVATFVTDIRGFTELSRNVEIAWGIKVFDLLSYCYFPQLTELLEIYGCHYLNYTGDGLLVLVMDRRDAAGRVEIPALDYAVLCSMELVALTNAIAEVWRRQGLVQASGVWHETGIGLVGGDVQVGDPFVPDHGYNGKCAEFDGLLRDILAEAMPHFAPRREFEHRVRAIHAMSPSINCASRLQDLDKLLPNHTCMMLESDVERLCPTLREKFERVGKMTLKGIGEASVMGYNRFEQYDVAELTAACTAFYRSPREA